MLPPQQTHTHTDGHVIIQDILTWQSVNKKTLQMFYSIFRRYISSTLAGTMYQFASQWHFFKIQYLQFILMFKNSNSTEWVSLHFIIHVVNSEFGKLYFSIGKKNTFFITKVIKNKKHSGLYAAFNRSHWNMWIFMQRNLNIYTTDKYLHVPKCLKHTHASCCCFSVVRLLVVRLQVLTQVTWHSWQNYV